jgi:hypothetical protein
MKVFVLKIMNFLYPIIIVIVGGEIYLRNINTVYSEKLGGLLKNSDSIEVLIIGNSHACYGISPTNFSMNTYNIAQSNQSIYFDKRITLKYINRLVNLKFVLISVDFHSLYFSSQGLRDVWSYYSYGINYKDQLPLLSRLSYLNGYTPAVAFSFFRKHFITNRPFAYPIELKDGIEHFANENRGWIEVKDTDWALFNQDAYKQRSLAFNNTVRSSNENLEVISDLEDFILKLKSKGVTPILVTLPVYKEFSPYLDGEFKSKNNIAIQQICDRYNLQHYDFSSEILPKSYFINCDHLNLTGARYISRILNNRLNHAKFL